MTNGSVQHQRVMAILEEVRQLQAKVKLILDQAVKDAERLREQLESLKAR